MSKDTTLTPLELLNRIKKDLEELSSRPSLFGAANALDIVEALRRVTFVSAALEQEALIIYHNRIINS